MSLKTKGFSRKTKALCLIGGGENRTLVLGKLRIDHYMLSVLIKLVSMQNATLRPVCPIYLGSLLLRASRLTPYQVNDDRL